MRESILIPRPVECLTRLLQPSDQILKQSIIAIEHGEVLAGDTIPIKPISGIIRQIPT